MRWQSSGRHDDRLCEKSRFLYVVGLKTDVFIVTVFKVSATSHTLEGGQRRCWESSDLSQNHPILLRISLPSRILFSTMNSLQQTLLTAPLQSHVKAVFCSVWPVRFMHPYYVTIYMCVCVCNAFSITHSLRNLQFLITNSNFKLLLFSY